MICLTGDVHHRSLKNPDIKFCCGSEVAAAKKAAEIAAKYGINITLFFTGKCAKEEPVTLRKISNMDNVEIGGHNYWAFKPRMLFNLYYRLTGLKNGPRFFQEWEVYLTLKTLKKVTNKNIISWRDHAYRNDRNTRRILVKNNVKYLSDSLSAKGAQPTFNQGLIDVPINTIPDHDYIYHGERQPGKFSEAPLRRSVFKTGAMTKDEWIKRIKAQVNYINNKGDIAVLLAHPACMEVIDSFKTFEFLCQFLSKFKTIKMKEIIVK